jgi:hypothetical protein
VELYSAFKYGSTYLDRVQKSKPQENPIDEFGLLTEMVKYDRINFLEHINKKAIFPIT